MAAPSRARQYLRGDRDVQRLRDAAQRQEHDDPPRGFLSDLAATWRLVRAYLRGEYRQVRLRSVLAVVAGLLYFLSPVDVIPDFFVILGFTDDVVVVSLVFSVVRQELAGFLAWEQRGIAVPVAHR